MEGHLRACDGSGRAAARSEACCWSCSCDALRKVRVDISQQHGGNVATVPLFELLERHLPHLQHQAPLGSLDTLTRPHRGVRASYVESHLLGQLHKLYVEPVLDGLS